MMQRICEIQPYARNDMSYARPNSSFNERIRQSIGVVKWEPLSKLNHSYRARTSSWQCMRRYLLLPMVMRYQRLYYKSNISIDKVLGTTMPRETVTSIPSSS